MKPLGAGLVVALAVFTASRLQLPSGGPGVMVATVPVPALVPLLVSLASAFAARSLRAGIEAGARTFFACFVAVAAVLAVEGLVWMQTWGVFMLDGDPPRTPVGSLDVALDFFTSRIWLGHLAFWLPWPLIGAGIGAVLGDRAALQARAQRA